MPQDPPAAAITGTGAGAIDALSLYRTLQPSTVSTSFQLQQLDQFGGQIYNRSNTTLANLSTQLGYYAIGSGNRATAVGAFAYAREDSAVALGVYSLALGPASIALGAGSLAVSYRAISIGNQGQAGALGAVAIGFKARATGQNSIAIGSLAFDSGNDSVAIGTSSRVTAASSVAIGPHTSIAGAAGMALAIAIGSSASVVNTIGPAIAIGNSSTVTATLGPAIALGTRAQVTGAGAGGIAIGDRASVSAAQSQAWGTQASAPLMQSIAVGQATVTTTTNQMMVGNPTFPLSVNISGPTPWIDVIAEGAVGDGLNDDTAAIQAAATRLVNTGGIIRFPCRRYKITSTITIQSLYPISLVGDMAGTIFDPNSLQPNAATIILGANIVGPMIKYTAPNSGSRAQAGGGRISGLCFLDALNRNYTCTAVLELNDFLISSVRDCVFQWIKGRAILGEFMVMSEIVSNVIRYCGDTGKPAIDLPSTNPLYPAQSLSIRSNRLEVNYNDAYIKVGFGAASNAISIIDNRFEAETSDSGSASDSNQLFIDFQTIAGKINGNNLSRNTNSLVRIGSKYTTFMGNTLTGGAYPTTAIVVDGSNNTLVGNASGSVRTGLEYDLVGQNNVLMGNALYFSGGIRAASGNGNVIANNTMETLTCTSAVLTGSDSYWINARGSAKTMIMGNSLSNLGGAVTDVGGIQVYGAQVCSGNHVAFFTGSASGAIGIKVLASTNNIVDNLLDSAPFSIDSYVASTFAGNYTSTGDTPLQGSAPFATITLSSNTSTVAVVTCTGAVSGDYAEFALDTLVSSVVGTAGTASDQVVVTLENVYTAAQTLSAGTLKVYVHKR